MKEVFVNVNTKISPEEILYCEADKNYTRIHYKNKMIIVPLTLKIIEEKLEKYNFFRIHRSFLVNMKEIKGLASKNSLALSDDTCLSISRRNLSGFLETWEKPVKRKTRIKLPGN